MDRKARRGRTIGIAVIGGAKRASRGAEMDERNRAGMRRDFSSVRE